MQMRVASGLLNTTSRTTRDSFAGRLRDLPLPLQTSSDSFSSSSDAGSRFESDWESGGDAGDDEGGVGGGLPDAEAPAADRGRRSLRSSQRRCAAHPCGDRKGVCRRG